MCSNTSITKQDQNTDKVVEQPTNVFTCLQCQVGIDRKIIFGFDSKQLLVMAPMIECGFMKGGGILKKGVVSPFKAFVVTMNGKHYDACAFTTWDQSTEEKLLGVLDGGQTLDIHMSIPGFGILKHGVDLRLIKPSWDLGHALKEIHSLIVFYQEVAKNSGI